jgi:hypothetical protein
MTGHAPPWRRLRGALLIAALAMGAGVGLTAATGSAASLPISSAALTPYRTCVLTATPTTTSVVADTEVRQATPTSNFGTTTVVTITSSGSANRRAYLRFDLTKCTPAIPATAIVRLATLRLYATALPAACRTLDIFAATAAWTETGVTWSSQPPGASVNNPPTSSRSGSFDAGTPVGCQNRTAGAYVVGATVTADMARFVAGSATNFGWLIRDDTEGSATARTVTFSSKDLGTFAQVPQLIVTYVVVL